MDGFLQKATQFAEQQFENTCLLLIAGTVVLHSGAARAGLRYTVFWPLMEPSRWADERSSHPNVDHRALEPPYHRFDAFNAEDKLMLIHA
ncbi:hypothetical protein JCM24511_05455 [Saitozyma sp. JCM 24511]|nr:hypothetical protein JCM24511_05455 [Saitozyma sp. JCM 24511]